MLTRPAALAVAVLLAVALSVHLPNGFFWTNGGVEYPLMWLALAIAIALRGSGATPWTSAWACASKLPQEVPE
ncbi:hypothetical protein [Fodinicurvata halophila]|uniref:hypothetical protein n=1 Tax=Fodinicurvata halophila TaxID=1419723 RepID=UPI003625A1D6